MGPPGRKSGNRGSVNQLRDPLEGWLFMRWCPCKSCKIYADVLGPSALKEQFLQRQLDLDL